MTPDQAKKPLPSSTCVAFLEQPTTQYEWRYVLKLIKVDYQRSRWKQCLVRCNRLLHATVAPMPLHATCLHFYAALSEEAIARQMHDMFMAKVESFQHAKLCFEQAILSLPLPAMCSNNNGACSTDSASEIDDTASLDDSVSSMGSPQPVEVTKMSSIEPFEQPISSIGTLKPLPLIICKAAQSGNTSFKEKRAFFEAKLVTSKSMPSSELSPKSPASETPSPATSPRMVSVSHCDNAPSIPMTSPKLNITGPHSRAQERYNEQLQDFAQILTKHIYHVDRAIATTREAQASGRRRLIKERKYASNEEDENAMDLRARIIKLKARGWIRERFMPERYQKICERALAEL